MKTFIPIAALVCASTCLAAELPATRPLCNGKDLAGWTGEGYVVEDGAIVCTPAGKVLMTEQTFSNYVLEFDFKLSPGGNSGLGIHYPGTGDGTDTGMELQILDNSDPKHKDLRDDQFNGSLYALAPAKKSGLKPVGEWNHERVSVQGPDVSVELNGETILRANLTTLAASHPQHEGVKRRAGHIAWLGHGDRVAFKDIRIAETPPAAYTEGVMAAGFTRLFNARNLDGWKHGNSPEWTAANGILKHSGRPGGPSELWTESEYTDCTVVFDWRWSGPLKPRELDSGVCLRGSTKSQVKLWNAAAGSGEVAGFRNDPAMPAEVKAGVTPKTRADRPIGEWNRTMITIQGDRLTVAINGRVVLDNARLPGVPGKGPIGLGTHGAAIDFANLWVKPL